MMISFKTTAPIGRMKLIHEQNLVNIYPNIEIALRIFLTISVTNVRYEIRFI